jgi:hypothetical protein
LERFLILIRDRYPLVEKASFFLETREGVSNVIGLANVRDVVNHLAALLDPSTPAEKRETQLANAEEHLRRAATEPYEIALGRALERFQSLHERARAGDRKGSQSPLTELAVNSRLAEVRELAAAGRNAKTRNLWDPAWEDGVAKMVGAYERLAQLNAELENDMDRLEQLRANRRHRSQTLPAVAGLCGTLLFGILSLALVLKPDFLDLLRRLLGLGR